MAVSDAWPLQQAVYSVIVAALADASESIQVFDHVPHNAPTEHIRLEGFDVADDSFKDTERGRHPVMIGFFRRQVSADTTHERGQQRVHEVLDIIHGAVKDLRHGRGRMQFEFKDVETGEQGVSERGTLRYTITI
ncbi:MAG: hypothetical protein MI867_05845 [Pseudomonadales bacterium]|nr:hypothetical protein [Pseudomonadales bacterium]